MRVGKLVGEGGGRDVCTKRRKKGYYYNGRIGWFEGGHQLHATPQRLATNNPCKVRKGPRL